VAQIALVLGLFYYINEELGGGFIDVLFYAQNPLQLRQFPLSFWLSVYFALIVSKFFKRSASVLGVVGGQLVVEYYHFNELHLLPSTMLVLVVVSNSFPKYKGGEYYRGRGVFKTIARLLSLFAFVSLVFSLAVDLSPYDATIFSPRNARMYLFLNVFVNALFIVFPYWLTMYAIDRNFVPYLPLTDEERALLEESDGKDSTVSEMTSISTATKQSAEYTSESKKESLPPESKETPEGEKLVSTIEEPEKHDEQYEKSAHLEPDILLPEPGEFYVEFLTHHSLGDDDHTIVLNVGKVRVYLCTRCTGMIFAVVLSMLYTKIAFWDFGNPIPPQVAFYLVVFLPIFPLTDWGLQALHIRKATTKSRLFTGAVLGFTIQMITHVGPYQNYMWIVTVMYFAIFAVLAKIRSKKENELLEKECLEALNGAPDSQIAFDPELDREADPDLEPFEFNIGEYHRSSVKENTSEAHKNESTFEKNKKEKKPGL